MPRNRELMRVFLDMELVEQIESGLSRILKVYDRSIFEFTQSFTVVTFPFEETFISSNEKINEKIKSILVIKEYPDVTIPKLVELTGRPKITIYRELQKHQASGRLHREGSRKKDTGSLIMPNKNGKSQQ